MAYTFRGIGLMEYGKRDFRTDGSYLTTRWFVFSYLPIFPLCSMRLRATGEVKYYSMRPVRVVATDEKTRPNLKQVICVYGWFSAAIVMFIAAAATRSWWFVFPAALLLNLPLLLRKIALDKIRVELERQRIGLSATLPD